MALETLIEPHQLVAVLQCVAAVGRVLLSGGWGRYVHIHTHFYMSFDLNMLLIFISGSQRDVLTYFLC